MINIIKYTLRIGVIIATCIIILIMSGLLVDFIIGYEGTMNMNWGVNIPRPSKVDVICDYNIGQDGEYLKIWYYNEGKIEKITNDDVFKNIDEQSKVFIKQKLDEYYKTLDDSNKNLFNANVDIDSLLLEENYFTYIEKEDSSWLLLILDYKNNKMFSFENIY